MADAADAMGDFEQKRVHAATPLGEGGIVSKHDDDRPYRNFGYYIIIGFGKH